MTLFFCSVLSVNCDFNSNTMDSLNTNLIEKKNDKLNFKISIKKFFNIYYIFLGTVEN